MSFFHLDNRPLRAVFFVLNWYVALSSSHAAGMESNTPDAYQARFEEGLQFMQQGNCLSAAQVFEQLEGETSSLRVKLEWARSLYCLGNYEQSETLFKEVLAANPPFPVRVRVGNYLNEMEVATGKLDYAFGLVRDTNPRAIPTNATINIFGTPLTYTPQFDSSPQYGLSYKLAAIKALDNRNETIASISTYGIKFGSHDFDINNYEVALSQRLLDAPRIQGRLSIERRYFAGEHLYDFPSLSFSHVLENQEGRYWKNELKVGTLNYPVYTYLNGLLSGFTTAAGMNMSGALGVGFELYVDRFNALETPYSYKTSMFALIGNYQFANGVTTQIRISSSWVKYDCADPFFGEVRADNKNSVQLSVAKPDFSTFGFTPALELGYEETHSNISFYTFNKTTMNLALRKAI